MGLSAIYAFRRQISWSWSYRHLLADQQGCWKLNSGPPEERQILLTCDPSSTSPSWLFLMLFFNLIQWKIYSLPKMSVGACQKLYLLGKLWAECEGMNSTTDISACTILSLQGANSWAFIAQLKLGVVLSPLPTPSTPLHDLFFQSKAIRLRATFSDEMLARLHDTMLGDLCQTMLPSLGLIRWHREKV